MFTSKSLYHTFHLQIPSFFSNIFHMETQPMNPNSPPSLSTTTTPYTTAPSSPHRFPNFFYSAPTSPIHSIAFQHAQNDHDFAFDFTGQPEPPSISAADELFHCGKIKPLSKPISPQTPPPINVLSKRPRETTTTTSTFRISDILSDEGNNMYQKNTTWYNKWNIKNLLLFRSASEGSVSRSKEQISKINKYARIKKGEHVDVRNSSFRSTDSNGSALGCNRRVSAHEIHYTANRAVAEQMKRKTYLPYKSGLLGCLGFHNNETAAGHEISRGITSVIKQRGY